MQESASGPSRHFRVREQSGRFQSEADIDGRVRLAGSVAFGPLRPQRSANVMLASAPEGRPSDEAAKFLGYGMF